MDWPYGQCVLAGTWPYYTYADEPGKLFFYSGKTTETIAVVGTPKGMFSNGRSMYYRDDGTPDVYSLNLWTNRFDKKAFSLPGAVYEIFDRFGTRYIAADDEEGHECLYTYGIYSGEFEKLLDTDSDRMRLVQAEKHLTCLFSDGSVYAVDYETKQVTHITEGNYVINTELYEVEGDDAFCHATDVLDNTAKGSTAFRVKTLMVRDDYYLPVRRETDGAEQYWVFDPLFTHILRVDGESGERQVVVAVPSRYRCGSLAVNVHHLLCIIGDTESDARYTYLMNPDGSNIRCIGARVNGKVLVGEEAKQAAAALTAALQANGNG